MSYDASKVAFVDIETTGLDPVLHYVWEIAVIVDDVEWVWQQRLPGLGALGRYNWQLVDPWVLENTGIRDRYDDEAAIDECESIRRLVALVAGRHLVGACPWFDSERLHRAVMRHRADRVLPWHYHLIDVETLAIGHLLGQCSDDGYPEPPSKMDLPWDSSELSLAIGVDPADFEPKHSALADARWAKAIYEEIMGGPR